MIRFMPRWTRDCQGLHRRHFLQVGALSGLGLSLPQLLASRQAVAKERGKARDVNCILIWAQGGISHHDTFDPKPEAGIGIRGDFKPLATPVPGVQFTEVVPNLAREFKRFAVLRSWNPKNGSHGVADQSVMSGYDVNPVFAHPCYGSIMSYTHGFKTKMPPFVQLGSSIDKRWGGGTSAYLGLQYNPFELTADPNATPFTVRDITPPRGIDSARLQRRRSMLGAIDALQQKADLQPAAFTAMDKHYQAALDMITAPETKQAFEIDQEPEALREKYGRNRFGQLCLLSRRLVEAGVRFVTIADSGWDTHADNFKYLRRNLPAVDQAVPALLADLYERGLLESTLVLVLTDFGRTPKINPAAGRDHWADAGFAIFAGAGTPGGTIVGRTDPEGARITRDEYFTPDIAATIYTKLGIPLDLMTTTADGRPIRLNEGRPIRELM